jgi:hypothetical protein
MNTSGMSLNKFDNKKIHCFFLYTIGLTIGNKILARINKGKNNSNGFLVLPIERLLIN